MCSYNNRHKVKLKVVPNENDITLIDLIHLALIDREILMMVLQNI